MSNDLLDSVWKEFRIGIKSGTKGIHCYRYKTKSIMEYVSGLSFTDQLQKVSYTLVRAVHRAPCQPVDRLSQDQLLPIKYFFVGD